MGGIYGVIFVTWHFVDISNPGSKMSGKVSLNVSPLLQRSRFTSAPQRPTHGADIRGRARNRPGVHPAGHNPRCSQGPSQRRPNERVSWRTALFLKTCIQQALF